MSKTLAELKETIVDGKLELKDIRDLNNLIIEALKSNRQQKPWNDYFSKTSKVYSDSDENIKNWYEQNWYENIRSQSGKKSGKTDMIRQYINQKPSLELQDVVEFTLQVVQNFKQLCSCSNYNEAQLLVSLAHEPHLTKSILKFAKEHNIGTTTEIYPDKLINMIADMDYDTVRTEQIKPFEEALVYKDLLNYIMEEADVCRQNPNSKVETSMFANLTTISEHVHTSSSLADNTVKKLLDLRTYDTFRKVAANEHQDIDTLRSAQWFLSCFLRNCRDKELEFQILQNIIPAASMTKKQKSSSISYMTSKEK